MLAVVSSGVTRSCQIAEGQKLLSATWTEALQRAEEASSDDDEEDEADGARDDAAIYIPGGSREVFIGFWC